MQTSLWEIKRFETKLQAVFEQDNVFFFGGGEMQAFYEITFTRKA